ncbi:hypothetical protein ACFW2D_29660 [Streptomyces sp. NPDC058914]|uniref:hypothetical protein n=1 Tax=Streptomyces sp. NPDC058914 TaxID=3346671 RepID=UPI0036A36FB8
MSLAVLATAFLLAVTFCYVVKCWLSPFGDCRKCDGMGHGFKTDRKGKTRRGKDCRRCDATGKRIRVGRWIYNRAARTYRAGTR